MTDSRVKGHKFENDVCKLIGLEFSISVRRNLEQTREGGGDIMLNPFLIECKRYAQQGSNWFKDDWWEQVKRASQNEFIPIWSTNMTASLSGWCFPWWQSIQTLSQITSALAFVRMH
jgi:hypothetical protein